MTKEHSSGKSRFLPIGKVDVHFGKKIARNPETGIDSKLTDAQITLLRILYNASDFLNTEAIAIQIGIANLLSEAAKIAQEKHETVMHKRVRLDTALNDVDMFDIKSAIYPDKWSWKQVSKLVWQIHKRTNIDVIENKHSIGYRLASRDRKDES